MSADQSGLLVAVCDEQMENGYCILWTDFMMKPQLATRLSKGTMGTWSPRNDFVVTWTFPEEPYPEENDCGCAFLWNVKKQCQPTEYTEVQNTLERNILWCRFALDMEGRDRLVMCVLETTVTFLFWDIENKTPSHTVVTSIPAMGATVGDRSAWRRFLVERSNVKGLSPIKVSANMKQIGAVSESKNRAMIWDAILGIQQLDISLPEAFKGMDEKGMDIMLSPTQPKFAVIRDISVLLFSPPTQSNLLPNTEVSQMIELENPNGGPDSRNAVFKMLFSHDGNSLGVLNVESTEMTVWHLLRGEKCTIASHLESGSLQDFCLSSNGERLVTCTSTGVVCIWDCTSEHGSVSESFKTSSASIAIGVKSDLSEIVVCSREGTLFWYCSSDEGTSDMTTRLGSHKRPTHVRWISSFLRESKSDGNSLVYERLDEPLMPSRSDVRATGHSRWLVSHEEQSLHGRVLHCRISSECDRAIRLLETKEAEIWDLTEKKMLHVIQRVNIESIRTSCSSQLLPLYRVRKNRDGIRYEVNASWNQVSSSLVEATILSENEDVLLTGLSSLPSSQDPTNASDELFQPNRTANSVSIRVTNIRNPNYSRELKACNLNPKRGLAISQDGRHVACLSGKSATAVIVWTCYASDELLPDYDSFDLICKWMANDVLLEKVKSLLNQYGVSFMNCWHSCGTSFLVKAILNSKPQLIEELLKHALKHNIKISVSLMKDVFVDGKLKSKSENLVSLSIHKDTPETVRVMMKYLVKRVTYEHEVSNTLEETLIPIGKKYPKILFDVVSSPELFASCNEIKIPERDPPSEGFFTSNNNSLSASSKELEEHWIFRCKGPAKRDGEVGRSPAFVGALPYRDVCQIGCNGLLRHLLAHGVHHAIFGAFALRALIACKWRTYARTAVMIKCLLHFLLLSAFMAYAIQLAKGTKYVAQYWGAKYEVEASSRVDWMLGSSIFLASLALLWKSSCVWTFVRERGLANYVFSPVFLTNLADIGSYILVAIVIPALHFGSSENKSDSISLSCVVAIETLLLWLRFLLYMASFIVVGKVSIVAVFRMMMFVPLVLFLAGITFGFAVAFFVLYRTSSAEHSDDDDDDVDHVDDDEAEADHVRFFYFGTLLRCIGTLLGVVFLDYIDLNALYYAPNPFVAVILFYFYLFTVSYIFLNVASDIITRGLGRIIGNEDTRFVTLRAAVIDEVDSELPSWLHRIFEKRLSGYLHVAIPKFIHGVVIPGTESKMLCKQNTIWAEFCNAWVMKARGNPLALSISRNKKKKPKMEMGKEEEEEEEPQSDEENLDHADYDDGLVSETQEAEDEAMGEGVGEGAAERVLRTPTLHARCL